MAQTVTTNLATRESNNPWIQQLWAIFDHIETSIDAPIISGNISTLGGVDTASLMLTIGLDARDTWNGGIFENSRYSRFRIDAKGIEQFSKHYKTANFRKVSKLPTKEKIVEKLTKWIEDSQA